MGFAEAKKIRGESLSNRIAGRLVGGESFGSSIGKSLSEGTKARMTGLREKINPMNIVKFMTGGSKLAAALTGRMTGASKEDMKYFTGKSGATTSKDTASKIKPLMNQQEGMFDMLEEIHKLLIDIREKRDADKPSEESIFEKQKQDERRHQELINAIRGTKTKKETDTATKENSDKSLLDNVLGAFGLKDLAKTTIKSLGGLAQLAVGGVGGVLLGGAAAAGIAYFMYKVLTDESSYEGKDSPLSVALKQAEAVGGLAGVKDEADRRKKLPEYERTMLELKDAENTFWKDLDDIPQKGTDTQLKGYAERSPEARRAVEDYKKERDAGKTPSVENKETSTVPPSSDTTESKTGDASTPTATAVPSVAAGTVSSMATETETPSATLTPSIENTASPMESTPSSAAVSAVTSQNLEMNLPTERDIKSNDLVNKTITNNTINSQNRVQQNQEVTMPSVRNSEETFKRMILYSTRVV